MQKLLINLSIPKRINEYDGGSEYSIKIITELVKLLGPERIIIHKTVPHSCIDNHIELLKEPKLQIIENLGSSSKELKKIIKNYNISLIYDPESYNSQFLAKTPLSGVKKILTLHGLRYVEVITDLNEKYLGKHWKYYLKKFFSPILKIKNIQYLKNIIYELNNQDTLITVSKSSKKLIDEILPKKVCETRVYYSPLKISKSTIEPHDSLGSYKTKDFLLMVSADRWIKNPYRLLNALNNLYSNGKIEHSTLILGSKKPNNIKISEKIHFLPYVSQSELEYAYKNCFCLLYPSLSEGFGYPPVEAMKFEKPIIASNLSVIREITNNQFLYFNPKNIKDIENVLLKGINQFVANPVKWGQLAREQFSIINSKQKKDFKELIDFIINEYYNPK